MNATTTEHTMINGIDVTALGGIITTIQGQPDVAKFQFRARNKWLTGGHNRSQIQGFYGAGQEDETRTQPFVLDNDEPKGLLGEDQAPNPVEYVLHALAGCMTSTMVYHAAARGIHLESVESELEGDIDLQGLLQTDPSVRSGFQAIRVTFRVKSDATPEQLEALGRLSPVFDTLSNPVAVSVQVQNA